MQLICYHFLIYCDDFVSADKFHSLKALLLVHHTDGSSVYVQFNFNFYIISNKSVSRCYMSTKTDVKTHPYKRHIEKHKKKRDVI